MTSGNIILVLFFITIRVRQQHRHLLIKLGDIYGFALHFRYSLHDAHQPEYRYFELRLIFGFEQLSFGCRKNRV